MTEPRLTPEMTAKIAAVHEARERLQDHHVKWIVDAAIEHFARQAEETETTIARYLALPDLPIYSRFGKARGDDYQGAKRENELVKLRADLGVCYAILDFLQALSDAECLRSTEAFAAAFRAAGGLFRGRSRAPRGGARR